MIIKGDLDRMAEDIGHAGKNRYDAYTQAPKQERGYRTFRIVFIKLWTAC